VVVLTMVTLATVTVTVAVGPTADTEATVGAEDPERVWWTVTVTVKVADADAEEPDETADAAPEDIPPAADTAPETAAEGAAAETAEDRPDEAGEDATEDAAEDRPDEAGEDATEDAAEVTADETAEGVAEATVVVWKTVWTTTEVMTTSAGAEEATAEVADASVLVGAALATATEEGVVVGDVAGTDTASDGVAIPVEVKSVSIGTIVSSNPGFTELGAEETTAAAGAGCTPLPLLPPISGNVVEATPNGVVVLGGGAG
jgi:hypothetical protein